MKDLKLIELKDNLTKIFKRIDVVYSSIHTSTFLESYSFGLPTLIFLDPNHISFPINNFKGLKFIISSKELLDINFKKLKANNDLKRFFIINESYPRWRKILINSFKKHMKKIDLKTF